VLYIEYHTQTNMRKMFLTRCESQMLTNMHTHMQNESKSKPVLIKLIDTHTLGK